MEISSPEVRICNECKSFLSLNLYKADSGICRYCETGQTVPRHLIKVISQADLKDDTANNEINNLNKVGQVESEKEQEINETNKFIEIGNKIFLTSINEIIITLGIHTRWPQANKDYNKVAEWIIAKNKIIESLGKDNVKMIKRTILENIDSTYSNLALIKGSIRSLLRKPMNQRIDYIRFIDKYIQSDSSKEEAIKILKEDLIKTETELGYKIPIIPFNLIEDWKDIKDLIPKFYINKNMTKTGLAGILAASLELTKEGVVKILQKDRFDRIMIKKI